MSVYVVISYDLAENPGFHAEFKAEMEALDWFYKRAGSRLPESTCAASFKSGVTESDAYWTTISDLKKAQAAVRAKHDKRFKITRWLVMASNCPPGELGSGVGL